MEELFAVSHSLSSHDVEDDDDNDIVGDVGGVLDDGITDEEEGSDIFEAVAGEEETNSGGFNSISQSRLDLLVQVAGVRSQHILKII